MFKHKLFTLLAAGCCLLPVAQAQDATRKYPSHSVTVIIPFPPGGTLDTVGRMLAQRLGEQTGQTFVVENRAGAGGVIGGQAVARANPDGYTLLFSASTFAMAPMVAKGAVYDVDRDFKAIALVAKAPLSVAVSKSVPAKNVAELVAYGKAQPGGLKMAIGSVASAGHLAVELLKSKSGVDYTVIQYKGSSPAYNDLIGGRIDGFIDPILGSVQFAKAGQLNVLAVTSAARVPSMPEVPTVGETYPGYEFYSWYGLWAPAKVPEAIAEFLNAEVNKALTTDMDARLRAQGLLPTPGSMADFRQFQTNDMAVVQKLITEGGIRGE
ncbi:MAG: tripartite tricarboxylate transporter substrate binding protein [Burkholderiales bacterium]